MKDDISIVNTRDNELEFDINIRGGDNKIPDVRLVIEDRGISYIFVCNNEKDDKWVVKIPKMPQLTKKAYPFRLEVIIDGYYFEPYRKSLTILGEPKVKTSDVEKNVPEEPTVSVSKKTDTTAKKKPVTKRPAKKKAVIKKPKVTKEDLAAILEPVISEKPKTPEPIVEPTPDEQFSDMAAMWMNRDKSVENKPVINERDKKVKNIIDDALTEPVIEPVIEVVDIQPEPIDNKPKIKENDIKVMDIINSTMKH